MELTNKQKEAIQYYKSGKIKKTIICLENSIHEENNNELVYEILGICYTDIGEYEKSIENFNKALNINNKNKRCIYAIINLLNFIKPKNFKDDIILSTNEKILSLNKLISNKVPNDLLLKDIFSKATSYVDDHFEDINYNQTQIFRRNEQKLDCDRHFKVFNKFKVIPKFCFDCYKIQITLENVVELVKLYFLFNQSFIKKSNLRKCMIETRSNIRGNYKALIYFSNPQDSIESLHIIKKKILENCIKTKTIEIKHGCSEFYNEYPDFNKINFKGNQVFEYNQDWEKYEKIIDSKIVKKNNLFIGTTLNSLTLSDYFIIKNWSNYAKSLGDNSYKEIF